MSCITAHGTFYFHVATFVSGKLYLQYNVLENYYLCMTLCQASSSARCYVAACEREGQEQNI